MADFKEGYEPMKPTWLSKMKQRHPILNTKRGVILVVALLVLPLFGLLGLLALRNRGSGVSGSPTTIPSTVILDDTHFYGQSEPVYPSPNMTGEGNWASAFAKARQFVSNMTLEEKVILTTGVVNADNGCVGKIPAIPRLNFPGLCLQDAGQGVRGSDFVSAWPGGIAVGASFNRNLTMARALGMGGEYRTKGCHVALGPVVGPMGRTIQGGRIWEGFTIDPYLSGALAYETIVGIQSVGVQTSIKHFIGNEQETNRVPESADGRTVEAVSSNIDDKTMYVLSNA